MAARKQAAKRGAGAADSGEAQGAAAGKAGDDGKQQKQKKPKKPKKQGKRGASARKQEKPSEQRPETAPAGAPKPRFGGMAGLEPQQVASIIIGLGQDLLSGVTFHGNMSWQPFFLLTACVLFAWSDRGTLGDRFHHAKDLMNAWSPGSFIAKTYCGFMKTVRNNTSRLIVAMMIELRMKVLAGDLCDLKSPWIINGRHVFAMDGTDIGAPWSDSNDRNLGQGTYKSRKPKKNSKKTKKQQKAAEKRAQAKRAARSANSKAHEDGRPQILLGLVWHLATGLPWAWSAGPHGGSERDMIRNCLATLPPRSILIGDAGFTGYQLWRDIKSGGHDFVIRVGANVRFLKDLAPRIESKGDRLWLWPSERQDAGEEPIEVRHVVLRLRKKGVMHVVTSVLNESLLSDMQIGILYRGRWGIEGWFRNLKQTFGKDQVRSLNSENALAELDWLIMGLALFQLHGIRELRAVGKSPRALSPAAAIRAVRLTFLERSFVPALDLPQLKTSLAAATVDTYQRLGPKTGKHIHRKKKHLHAGSPKILQATAAQRAKWKEIIEGKQAA